MALIELKLASIFCGADAARNSRSSTIVSRDYMRHGRNRARIQAYPSDRRSLLCLSKSRASDSSWVRGSHPSKGAKDGAPTVVVIQAKVKGVGQECPTHMGRLHPLTREVEVDVLTRADGDSVYGGGAETPVLQRGNYFLVDVLLE